jgi:hypothetical protein
MTAAQALEQHGLDGRRLLGIARDVSNRRCAASPFASPQLRDDLASFLVEQGLAAALTYDPARSKPGYSFASYLWDIMALRTADFFRRKSEGFGDRRSGNDNRIVLMDDPWEGIEPSAREQGFDLVDCLLSLPG